jgi:phytoene dehydrogenase-like protein
VYRLDKVQDENWDAIVIGSGIGGLTTASLLAQEGQKVLVLEQHYVAGGACHTFDRKGFRFATGIHYVGEMGNDDTEMSGLQVSLKLLLDTCTPANDPIIWDRMNGKKEWVPCVVCVMLDS